MRHRRDVLRMLGATAAAMAVRSPLVARPARKKVLVFTRSAGFQHDVAKLQNGTCLVHQVLEELGRAHDFDVTCTKDGRALTPELIPQYDAFFFYTTGDLTAEKSTDGTPPMPRDGKKALLDAILAGKGFVGSHCATDTFPSGGGRKPNADKDIDPYIKMIGGEFIGHGAQQTATLRLTSPRFPRMPAPPELTIHEEWYSFKNQPKDLHVILAQETAGMKGHDYQRPRYPSTWARLHGEGRVFYTALGHRDDVWKGKLFQMLLLGGLEWASRRVDAEVTPNAAEVTPEADTMPPPPPPPVKKNK